MVYSVNKHSGSSDVRFINKKMLGLEYIAGTERGLYLKLIWSSPLKLRHEKHISIHLLTFIVLLIYSDLRKTAQRLTLYILLHGLLLK